MGSVSRLLIVDTRYDSIEMKGKEQASEVRVFE